MGIMLGMTYVPTGLEVGLEDTPVDDGYTGVPAERMLTDYDASGLLEQLGSDSTNNPMLRVAIGGYIASVLEKNGTIAELNSVLPRKYQKDEEHDLVYSPLECFAMSTILKNPDLIGRARLLLGDNNVPDDIWHSLTGEGLKSKRASYSDMMSHGLMSPCHSDIKYPEFSLPDSAAKELKPIEDPELKEVERFITYTENGDVCPSSMNIAHSLAEKHPDYREEIYNAVKTGAMYFWTELFLENQICK